MATKLADLTPSEIRGSSDKPLLIAAKPTITVRKALTTMEEHNITSLPIYSHDSDSIVTIVNLVDVLNYIIKEAVADEKLPSKLDSEKSLSLNNQIEVVMTLDADRESYRMFKADANEPILPVLKAFSSGIHRCLVIDYTDKVPSYVLTQTDIIRYIHANPECLSGIDLDRSLESFGLAEPRDVIVGKDNETALNVYRRMAEKSLTGIPIVQHDNGQLIGTLSVSDLRGLNYASINNLVLPVLEFLATLPKAESTLNPITVTKDIALKDALKLIVDNHIHRLWVVNKDKKVENVVSLTDLVSSFLQA